MDIRKILILGGGISGSSAAYYLTKKGYKVTIIERERIGGLCVTDEKGGVKYEFGPHILYASDEMPSFELFHKLIPEFKPIKYFPKQSMDGEITDLATFPITVANVLKLPKEDQVKAIEELYHVNLDNPCYDSFERYIISRVGKTMYDYCYKNYNRKQWGMEPGEMDSEWARFRNFYLRSGDFGMFGDKWQGHPGTYNPFFERLTKGVEIIYDNVTDVELDRDQIKSIKGRKDKYEADVIISTLPIDFIIGENDSLLYRGIVKLYYLLKGKSGLPTYLTTFPNHYPWTRITDYELQTELGSPDTIISFAIPHSSLEKELNITDWANEADSFISSKLKKEVQERWTINHNYVYPVSSGEMLKRYNNMIKYVSEIKNLITFGRLGLYSYISMCTAADQAKKIADNLEVLLDMNADNRYGFYKELRSTLS